MVGAMSVLQAERVRVSTCLEGMMHLISVCLGHFARFVAVSLGGLPWAQRVVGYAAASPVASAGGREGKPTLSDMAQEKGVQLSEVPKIFLGG